MPAGLAVEEAAEPRPGQGPSSHVSIEFIILNKQVLASTKAPSLAQTVLWEAKKAGRSLKLMLKMRF